jgi:hypothetical protein
MSRPRRIHERRASSRRSPVDSATAVASPAVRPGGSIATRSVSARRARPARRRIRSATFAGVVPTGGRGGRSMTRTSTERPARRTPAIDSPSSRVSGVRTTSQSSRTPRATASTGSRARARSSQATIAPSTWASATSRRARVVAPDDGVPLSATLALRGRPPGPRIASRAGKPVRMIRSTPVRGSAAGASSGNRSGSAGSGTVASAPTTRGAAAPHRVWRDARAADTSGERLAIGRSVSNIRSSWSRSRPRHVAPDLRIGLRAARGIRGAALGCRSACQDHGPVGENDRRSACPWAREPDR